MPLKCLYKNRIHKTSRFLDYYAKITSYAHLGISGESQESGKHVFRPCHSMNMLGSGPSSKGHNKERQILDAIFSFFFEIAPSFFKCRVYSLEDLLSAH